MAENSEQAKSARELFVILLQYHLEQTNLKKEEFCSLTPISTRTLRTWVTLGETIIIPDDKNFQAVLEVLESRGILNKSYNEAADKKVQKKLGLPENTSFIPLTQRITHYVEYYYINAVRDEINWTGFGTDTAQSQLKLLIKLLNDFSKKGFSVEQPKKGSLPNRNDKFIGRDEESKAVKASLLETNRRLAVLWGPGGIGKTRLAEKTAESLITEFPDGIYFVDLVNLTQPSQVLQAIAKEIGIQQSINLLQSISIKLSGLKCLFILDNFENVIDSTPDILALCNKHAKVRFLITSRQKLNITQDAAFYQQEIVPFQLSNTTKIPLEVEKLSKNAAIALFMDRVQLRNPKIKWEPDYLREIILICEKTEGIPLVIELAAAFIPEHSFTEIRQALDSRLQNLTRGPLNTPPRHQNASDLIGWSYNLLSPSEKVLFSRLGIFRRGCYAQQLLEVCDDLSEVVATANELRHKSLVTQSRLSEISKSRFGMLEIIQEFALTKLSEPVLVQRKHAEIYKNYASAANPNMRSTNLEIKTTWFTEIEPERGNFRQAIEFFLSNAEPENALSMALALAPLWIERGYFAEGREYLEKSLLSLGEQDATTSSPLQMSALNVLGLICFFLGDYLEAKKYLQECVRLVENTEQPDLEKRANHNLGLVQSALHEKDAALDSLQRSQKLSGETGLSGSQLQIGVVFRDKNDLARARFEMEKSHYQSFSKSDPLGEAAALSNIGDVSRLEGDYDDAIEKQLQSLAIYARHGNPPKDVSRVTSALADALLAKGNLDEALEKYEEANRLFTEIGYAQGKAYVLAGMGKVHQLQGNFDKAVSLFRESLEIGKPLLIKSDILVAFEGIASLAFKKGEYLHSFELWAAFLNLVGEIGTGIDIGYHKQVLLDKDLAAAQLPPEDVEKIEEKSKTWSVEQTLFQAFQIIEKIS